MRRDARSLLTPAVCLAMALAGCSALVTVDDGTVAVIPKGTVEDEIADSLEKTVGQRPDDVECPEDLSAQQGESIRCVLHAGTDRLGVTATVTAASVQNSELDYQLDVKVDDKPMS